MVLGCEKRGRVLQMRAISTTDLDQSVGELRGELRAKSDCIEELRAEIHALSISVARSGSRLHELEQENARWREGTKLHCATLPLAL